MNRLFQALDDGLTKAAYGLKAATTMTFQRSWYWSWSPSWRTRYAGELQQGLNSSIVLAVTGWAQRNFTQAPLRVRKITQDGKRLRYDPVLPSDAGPGAILQLWDYPNDYYSGRTLQKAMLLDYMTEASCYALKLRNGAGRVVELWWLPAMLVTPYGNEHEYISYYRYNPNGIPIDIPPSEVIHIKDGMDPRDPKQGLNRLKALAREIFTDEEAAQFSATVLSNMGVPGVIISPESTGIAANNRIADPAGVKQRYIETFGGERRGEPMVLTAPTKVQVLSWSPDDMKLTDLRRVPEERLAAVFGIAAVVVGLGAGLDRSTYSNMEEARQAATEEFLVPHWSDWGADLRVQLLNEFADWKQYVVDFDLTEVRVLQEDQNKLWERNLNALNRGGITRRVFKENVGEEADDTDDVYYIPTTVTVTNAEDMPPPTAEEQAATQVAQANAEAASAAASLPQLNVPPSAGAPSNGHTPPALVGA